MWRAYAVVLKCPAYPVLFALETIAPAHDPTVSGSSPFLLPLQPMAIYLIMLMAVLSQMAFSGSRIAVSLYALELGANQFQIGILVSLYAIFPMLLAISVGKFVDRVAPWVPLTLGIFGMTLGFVLPPLFPGIAVLYITCMLLGIMHQFFLIPVEAGVGGIGGPEKRAGNYSLLSMAWSIANFFAPMIAGFSIDHIGHVQVFWVLAAISVTPILVLWLCPGLLPRTPMHSHTGNRGSAIDLWRNPGLRTLFIAGGIIGSAQDLFQFYFPIYGHSLGMSASAIGTIVGMMAAAAFLIRGLIPFLVKVRTEAQILTYAVFIAAFAFVLLPFVTNAYVLAAIAFLLGLGVGCANPMSMSLVYVLTPHGRVAESMGLRKTVNNVTHLIVPVVFGTVGSAFGYSTVFLSNSVMLVTGGFLMRKSGKLISERPAQ